MKPRSWATPSFCAFGANFGVLKSSPHGALHEILCRIAATAEAHEIAVATPGFYRGQSRDSGDLGCGRHDSPRDGIDLWGRCTRRRTTGPCAADRIRAKSRARRIEPPMASCCRRRWSDRVPEDIPATPGAGAALASRARTRQGWSCGPFAYCGCRRALTPREAL